MNQKDMPEAIASATLTYKSPTGAGVLFSIRSEDPLDLITKVVAIEDALLSQGFTVQDRKPGFNREVPTGQRKMFMKKELNYVPDRTCPTCGEKLVFSTTKTGKKLIKCSTQGYDYATKKTTGCPFVEWEADSGGEPKEQDSLDKALGVKRPTEPQIALFKKLQKEGRIDEIYEPEHMTFEDVKNEISVALGKKGQDISS